MPTFAGDGDGNSDPIEDKGFKKGMYAMMNSKKFDHVSCVLNILKESVHKEEIYDLQMEIINQRRGDGLADALASQLWETYSPTPMRLLHM